MRRIRSFMLLTLGILPALGFAQTGSSAPQSVDDMMVVDCLLPGKVRSLGRHNTFVEPRRAVRATAQDCQIRGGEFTQYDRADYRTSLAIWLKQAEGGDLDAQYYVGQLYERGQSGEPDFIRAASWYEKAAAHGHHASQISLGYLYEKGLGVVTNAATALNWYRRAAGVPAELVLLESDEYQKLLDSQGELKKREDEIDMLRRQLEELKKSGGSDRQRSSEMEQRLDQLTAELELRRQQIRLLQQRTVPAEATVTDHSSASGIRFGKFYALVIGNSEYRYLNRVGSSETDAREVAAVLREQYGFQVKLLTNATRFDIMTALNSLREMVTEQDNLLVYYAGHGERDVSSQRGWWLPVDAERENSANWLSNQVISEHLNLIPARHILLLADSCYEGALTRSSVPSLPRGMSPERKKQYIQDMLSRKSRLALTSGADSPVAVPGEARSRFASAVIASLRRDSGVFEASALYREVTGRVTAADASASVPTFAPIRWASHEGSDFFFVRKPGS
jgi:hypothetical protein